VIFGLRLRWRLLGARFEYLSHRLARVEEGNSTFEIPFIIAAANYASKCRQMKVRCAALIRSTIRRGVV
jgi:hypothetical protein